MVYLRPFKVLVSSETIMEAAFALVVVVLAGAMLFAFLKLREANARLAEVTTSGQSVEGRLTELRKELGAARDDAAKKSKALEEARAEAKKKARREGKKMQRQDETAADETTPGTDSGEEVARLKQAISGLEQQIKDLLREGEMKAETASSDAASVELRNQLEAQLKAAREETKAVQRTLDDLRESVRKKAEDRPDVPGTAVDLKALPTEAVQELARYFRKAEEFERLYGVAQGRLQLAQERAQELQKRYYAVCRELALMSGGSHVGSDEEARQAAESVVDKSDAVAASPGGAPQVAAAPGEEGAKKKKRRRRRRKKKPGEAGMAGEGAEGAEDGDSDADGDEEGDDEGEELSATSETSAPAQTEAAARESSAAEAAPEPAAAESSAAEAAPEPAATSETSTPVQTEAAATEPSATEAAPERVPTEASAAANEPAPEPVADEGESPRPTSDA